MLLGSDGYEYEDLTQRLLGIKAKTPRNERIENEAYNAYFGDPQALKIFIQGYDDWKVKLNPFYWFESETERGWMRHQKGREAVIDYWANKDAAQLHAANQP